MVLGYYWSPSQPRLICEVGVVVLGFIRRYKSKVPHISNPLKAWSERPVMITSNLDFFNLINSEIA